jgi:hypothetical protein
MKKRQTTSVRRILFKFIIEKLILFNYFSLYIKCQSPSVSIVNRISSFKTPQVYAKNTLITIVSQTQINCVTSLDNLKEWSIFIVNNMTRLDEKQIYLKTNPTLTYAELVLQPQTLSYGLYRIVFTATQILSNSTEKLSNSIDTFIRIVPSGLVISSLKLSRPMYGGTIEITRGSSQSIQFDPYLFSYDIDTVAVITSLKFEYSCQIANQAINATVRVRTLDKCFNGTKNGLSNFILFFVIFE